MALNIKSDEAHRLARELAETRGESMTTAVTVALRRLLEAESQSGDPELLVREIGEIQRFVADLPARDCRTADEILGYDPAGIPD